ncbi:FAD-dependent oxidoreductase [Microbacterium helvum]|uniref:FAD-dependent oxidoreductase n=1 Tax=Microbacterium helvum TaxID=2773713 RepID=UPI0029644FB0|nr:FAD-dependent oxidoreductase [Microbacterium helvum]
MEAGGERYDIFADTVVVTAGAWTAGILPRSSALPRLTVTEESPAHFAPRSPDHAWPSFNHFVDPQRGPIGNVYGMPTPGEGVKVGFHMVGPVVDPDERTFRPVPEQAAQLRDYVAEWFRGLDADTAAPISCAYTSTVTEDFVLDRRGRIVVGAGFSGHGFTFTPAVGSVLADLATDDTARAAEPFRLP